MTTLVVKTIKHKYFLSGTANFLFSNIKPPKNFIRELNLSQRLVQLAEIASGCKINVPPPPLPLDDKYRKLAKVALPKNNYVGKIHRENFPRGVLAFLAWFTVVLSVPAGQYCSRTQ